MGKTKLTNVGAAFIYRDAKFSSETVSQTLLGEEVDILESQADWFLIRQSDGYQGWIASNFLCDKPSLWDDLPKFRPEEQIIWIHQSPDEGSSTIRDMTLLSELPILDQKHGWSKLLLPDGSEGWVNGRKRTIPGHIEVESLLELAMDFLGTPYFWGGRSPKGYDCSGFVQSVFKLHGFQLPRDAYLQAELGEEVSDDWKDWEPGDLIYFSERPNRITHVALSLGEGDFIHASGYVKLNSVNPDHEDLYIDKYAKIYTCTRRVL